MGNTRSPRGLRRTTVRVLRVLLWPAATLRPKSVWARMHTRLRMIDEHLKSERRPQRRVSPPLMVFVVLIVAAAALWIRDVLRRPQPEPTRRSDNPVVRTIRCSGELEQVLGRSRR